MESNRKRDEFQPVKLISTFYEYLEYFREEERILKSCISELDETYFSPLELVSQLECEADDLVRFCKHIRRKCVKLNRKETKEKTED